MNTDISFHLFVLSLLSSHSYCFQCINLSPLWINLLQNFYWFWYYCKWDYFLYFFFWYSNGIFHTHTQIMCLETQKALNRQSNPKKEKSWRHYTSWFKTILQTIVIKITQYYHKNRHQDQWNTVVSTEINPKYSMRKDSLFSKWHWGNWLAS